MNIKRSRELEGNENYAIGKFQKTDRRSEFMHHLKALNISIHDWFQNNLKGQSLADLSSAAQEYSGYIKNIENRYLRKYGEVLTFGSGDCGQV